MKLHENAADFESAVRATAQNLGIRELYIEKDYWLTFLLKRVALFEEGDTVIFKGGTSLTKAYGILRRFSEDIDLAVLKEGRTSSQIERLIKQVSKTATQKPLEEIEEKGITSKKGMSRRTVHQYPRVIPGAHFGPVRDTLLLEINCFVEPIPHSLMPIRSLIAEHLMRVDMYEQILEYELEPFKLLVLDYRKTFTEKILSLAYASLMDGMVSMSEIRARIRHFYDLTILLRQPDVMEFMKSKMFEEWIREVRLEEKLSTRLKWVDRKLSKAPLFENTFQILTQVEQFFKSDLEPLVFAPEDLPEFAEVKNCFEIISESINRLDL